MLFMTTLLAYEQPYCSPPGRCPGAHRRNMKHRRSSRRLRFRIGHRFAIGHGTPSSPPARRPLQRGPRPPPSGHPHVPRPPSLVRARRRPGVAPATRPRLQDLANRADRLRHPRRAAVPTPPSPPTRRSRAGARGSHFHRDRAPVVNHLHRGSPRAGSHPPGVQPDPRR